MQVLQQPGRGGEEGAAPVLCAEEAGRPGPRLRQAAPRHSAEPAQL